LRELLQHLGLRQGEPKTEQIVRTSICIPSNMPYVNNIWLPRKRGDRPPVVPEGVTNLGLMGQYVELERDIAFTFEYSTRTAWEATIACSSAVPPLRMSTRAVRFEGRVGGYESVSGTTTRRRGSCQAGC
jgi:myosin-crossreactive antigen